MYWLKIYLLSLLLPFVIHSVMYLFDLGEIRYEDADNVPVIIGTGLLWPLVFIILIGASVVVGFTHGMKALKKKIKKTIADRKEAKRLANEVVNEEVEVVATTRRR